MTNKPDNVVALAERLNDQDAKRIAELATSVERSATVKHLREVADGFGPPASTVLRVVARRIEKGEHVP